MRDKLTKSHRSWNMSRIRSKNTSPELRVRSALHKLGFRFRLHVRIPIPSSQSPRLRVSPASPRRSPSSISVDILLPKYKTAIFVHGCFWHRHRGCKNCTTPTNRREWWVKKLEGNAARDKVHLHALRKLGWRTITIWECQTEDAFSLLTQISPLIEPLTEKA